jgi:hypothetical protein
MQLRGAGGRKEADLTRNIIRDNGTGINDAKSNREPGNSLVWTGRELGKWHGNHCEGDIQLKEGCCEAWVVRGRGGLVTESLRACEY